MYQRQTQMLWICLMGGLQMYDTNLKLQSTPAKISSLLQLRELAAETRESRIKQTSYFLYSRNLKLLKTNKRSWVNFVLKHFKICRTVVFCSLSVLFYKIPKFSLSNHLGLFVFSKYCVKPGRVIEDEHEHD